MARQYEGKVQLIGLAGRDSVAAMRDFVQRHGLGLVPHVADADGKVWAELDVRYQPSWIFVNGSDGAVSSELGDLEVDELRSRLDALVAR